MALYSFLLLVTLVAGAPYWVFRMAVSGRYRAGLPGRLGFLPEHLRVRLSELRLERRGGGGLRPLMWIHAVSVGEVLAAARLIEEFRQGEFQRVRPGMVFAVSTTTEAGNRLACERLPGCAVFYIPLDFAFAVRRYLRLLQPEMVVLIESELWPRLITECAAAGIPLAVANARISDRSFPRYMRLKAVWRPILGKVGVFLAQSEETADRLRRLGAPRVELTGNLKHDARPAKETALVAALRSRLQSDAEVVVCGSTLEGEEAIILDAWNSVSMASSRAVLVIAPRHPARFDEVATMLAARLATPGNGRRIAFLRASTFSRIKVSVKAGSVFLLDTIGDLASMYSLAEVAFVGGSLVGAGGHNPLEPAQFGVPVVMGSSFENFREMVETMRAAGGIRIVRPDELATVLVSLLRNRDDARAMGMRGKAVSAAQAGAASRTAASLVKLLPVRAELPEAANGMARR